MLASTAIPMVSAIPAMPGNVSVAPSMLINPIRMNRLSTRAISANKPNKPYVAKTNARTKAVPIRQDFLPDSMESVPNPGPTIRSSTTSSGAGKAPERNINASSLADCGVKLPVMMPLPPVMADLISGAVITLPSKTMARRLPTFSRVAMPKRLAPCELKRNETTDSIPEKSPRASDKCSPPTIDLRFTT